MRITPLSIDLNAVGTALSLKVAVNNQEAVIVRVGAGYPQKKRVLPRNRFGF
jgi:hypothetical protein